FDASQGVPCEDIRYMQQPRQLGACQPGIGVMAMDDVGDPGPSEVDQRLIDEHLDIGPQGFLSEVPLGPKGDANYRHIFSDWLYGDGVVIPNLRIEDLPG